jgi:hypothetical protein
MLMTAEECRARANECIDLAEGADKTAREQLLKMAEAWLKLAATATEQQSQAEPPRAAVRERLQ